MDTQLNEPSNQNPIKVPKFVKLTNKKTLFKTLETNVITAQCSLLPKKLSLEIETNNVLPLFLQYKIKMDIKQLITG